MTFSIGTIDASSMLSIAGALVGGLMPIALVGLGINMALKVFDSIRGG